MTWRDDVGADAGEYGPVRAGWEILDSARSIAFTGEIEFALMPTASVYLDRGRIYYAERSDDLDVADRLVAMGVVRADELARGVLTSDDTDHLGRLFDRVPTLDRQRVMLALEHITAETTAWVARQSVGEAVTRPYEYHPSGVHQWYEPATSPAPGAALPPPAVGGPAVRARRAAPPAPEEHLDGGLHRPTTTGSDPAPAPSFRAVLGVDEPDEPAPAASAAKVDFELHWPSGEVGHPTPPGGEFPAPQVVAETRQTASADGFDRFDPPGGEADLLDPGVSRDDVDDPGMTIAVRRAMAAVASGTARGRPVSPVLPVLDDMPDPFARWSETSSSSSTSTSTSDAIPDGPGDDDPFAAFAPSPSPEGLQGSAPLAPPLPGSGGGPDDRRTALQRLIDGLRSR